MVSHLVVVDVLGDTKEKKRKENSNQPQLEQEQRSNVQSQVEHNDYRCVVVCRIGVD